MILQPVYEPKVTYRLLMSCRAGQSELWKSIVQIYCCTMQVAIHLSFLCSTHDIVSVVDRRYIAQPLSLRSYATCCITA
jgi:hypothetical protein